MYLFSGGFCLEWSGNDLRAEPEQTKVRSWSMGTVTANSSETTLWLECRRVVGAWSVAGVCVIHRSELGWVDAEAQAEARVVLDRMEIHSLCRVCFNAVMISEIQGSN